MTEIDAGAPSMPPPNSGGTEMTGKSTGGVEQPRELTNINQKIRSEGTRDDSIGQSTEAHANASVSVREFVSAMLAKPEMGFPLLIDIPPSLIDDLAGTTSVAGAAESVAAKEAGGDEGVPAPTTASVWAKTNQSFTIIMIMMANDMMKDLMAQVLAGAQMMITQIAAGWESAKDGAEATREAGRAQADSTRAQANNQLLQGSIGIASGAVSIGGGVVAGAGSTFGTRATSVDSTGKAIQGTTFTPGKLGQGQAQAISTTTQGITGAMDGTGKVVGSTTFMQQQADLEEEKARQEAAAQTAQASSRISNDAAGSARNDMQDAQKLVDQLTQAAGDASQKATQALKVGN